MTIAFHPRRGLIIVRAVVTGPAGNAPALLALDTGATQTSVSLKVLVAAGYDPTAFPANARLTTGSGSIVVPRIPIVKINALNHNRSNFTVLAHTLPPQAAFDGLLGLDFLRGQVLTLDFRQGLVTLA